MHSRTNSLSDGLKWCMLERLSSRDFKVVSRSLREWPILCFLRSRQSLKDKSKSKSRPSGVRRGCESLEQTQRRDCKPLHYWQP